jgi:hypothetical protein
MSENEEVVNDRPKRQSAIKSQKAWSGLMSGGKHKADDEENEECKFYSI